MLRVTPIQFTDHPSAWRELLVALGMKAVVEAEEWSEFDCPSGGVRLHAASPQHPSGTALLAFEVGDLYEFARRTRQDGGEVDVVELEHGPTALISGPDGVVLQATVSTRDTPEGEAGLHVLPVWSATDVHGAVATLRAIGARDDEANTAGDWRQFTAKNGGLIAVHADTESGAALSFQYDADLERLRARLSAADIEVTLVDEAYGRSLRIANPDGGGDIWVNETHPVVRRLKTDDAADVFAAFGSHPDMARQGNVAALADAEKYVTALLRAPHEPWAISLGGRLIGLVCVSVDEENLSGWFWYWMHTDGRGRGWTARAAATVANWALADRGLERLELGHRVNNPASGAVAVAAGFVKEGTERGKFLIDGERIDVDTFGRLASDPAPLTERLPMSPGCGVLPVRPPDRRLGSTD